MARNIEIKARIATPEQLQQRVAQIADSGPTPIFQDDTFFACEGGRLKLRDFGDGHGELIFYRRADLGGPKSSFYVRSPTASPDTLREALQLAHGVSGRVVKQRRLYLQGQTRIHLDEVQGLGHFMELEVVLTDNQGEDDGIRIAEALMVQLAITPDMLVEGAYVDLLHQQEADACAS